MLINYKNIIKSRALRVKILNFLSWIPDRIMVTLQYWIHTGRRCNLKNPKRLTEKLQLYKLTYRNPLMLRCTDKSEVRKVIKEFGYADYLIPLVGIYNNTDEIDFQKLPDKFVVKTTDGGGGNQVWICKNKNEIDANIFFSKLNEWLRAPRGKNVGREWAYENNYSRKIIIEHLIIQDPPNNFPIFEFYGWDSLIHFFCINEENKNTKIWFPFDAFTGDNHEISNRLGISEKELTFLRNYLSSYISQPGINRISFYSEGKNEFFLKQEVYSPISTDSDKWTLPFVQSLKDTEYNEIDKKPIMIDFNKKDIYEPGLIDYKFFCFNGKVKFIYGVSGRKVGVGAEFGIYTPEWNKLDVSRLDEYPALHSLKKPENLIEMINFAEEIASHFPHVRVDLYSVNSKIYFGELTFYDGSGYMEFSPDSFDNEAGDMFEMRYLNQ